MMNPRFTSHSLTQTSNNSAQPQRSIAQAQEIIYTFLLENVKQIPAEAVLQQFVDLFISPPETSSLEPIKAIKEIIEANNREEFYNTIKRCCYILLNNWKINKKTQYVQHLITILENVPNSQHNASPTVNHLRLWMQDFVNSPSYAEVKALADKCQGQKQGTWTNRYSSHLLVAQSHDSKKTIEQREAAKNEASKLKYQFKFDLAMYMGCSQSSRVDKYKNPTSLPDEVLRLIKLIVAKRGPESYTSTANIFIKQTKNLNYGQFKERLEKYLVYASDSKEIFDTSRLNLSKKLATLNTTSNDKAIADTLVLRTCNKIIDYLTTENHHDPSPIFVTLISQGNPMTLVMTLIKIILICRSSRTHLETCIAELIRYYENYSEKERSKMTTFLDIFNVMNAIYVDNVPVKL